MQSAYTQFRNMTVMAKAKRRQLVKGSAAFTLLLALALLGGSATASAQDDSKNQDASKVIRPKHRKGRGYTQSPYRILRAIP